MTSANYIYAFIGIVGAACLVLFVLVRWRSMHLWLPTYSRQLLTPSSLASSGPIHIMLCIADHFEPSWGRPSSEVETARVNQWVERYPQLASRHHDYDGKVPQYSFFFPEEEYKKAHLDALAKLCKAGFGDVEVHLHHDSDTAEGLRAKLERFAKVLFDVHGLLRKNPATGKIEYAFIHGNWTLNNSGPDGKLCGVNNELVILSETGCYADFTFPSAPSPTQTSKINSIYYASDRPGVPKSHDCGIDVSTTRPPSGDLMMIQGPLTLNWKARKFGVIPRIENGELSGDNPPTPARVDLWIKQNINVIGQPNWIFIKLHTHGANEKNVDMLLGEPADRMFSYLESRYNDGARYCLHYVTAREMYNIIKAAELGKTGNPSEYRDVTLQQARDAETC